MTAEEFSDLHSIFTGILQEVFQDPLPILEVVREMLGRDDSPPTAREEGDTFCSWLHLLDRVIIPFQLRRYGQEQGFDASTSRTLLRYWIGKKTHSADDRNKVDWLATHFFKVREEESKQPLGWVKSELQVILKGISLPSLGHQAQALLDEFPPLLDDVQSLQSFHQITDLQILAQGRQLKEQLGEDFFHPTALAAIVNYNLVLGKKFGGLLESALLHRGSPLPGSNLDLPTSLLTDYHTTAPALKHVGDLSRKHPKEGAEAATTIENPFHKHLRQLGVNVAQELGKLRGRLREVTIKLKSEPGISSIRICGKPLPLEEWELQAFRVRGRESEENLQAEIARCLRYAIGIILRIYEEMYDYESKKASGDSVKGLPNSLLYLLFEGRGYKESLLRFGILCRKSGLAEAAEQLAKTAGKLETNLAQVEESFSDR